jgi:hypothetical protein
MNHFHSTGTPAVYRRTTKGQFAATAQGARGAIAMDAQHRRLLLLVNGYTTLDAIARIGMFEARPELLALDLEASGLIEQAEHRGSRPMAYGASGPPWHLAGPTGGVSGAIPGTMPVP